jgi:DNA uptake protein ComE-like DNA-binding protein
MRLLVIVAIVLSACGLFRRHEGETAPAPIDLNRASVRKVEELPGITPSMAARIVAGRPYDDPHALVERGILTPRELERIEDRVTVPDADRRR